MQNDSAKVFIPNSWNNESSNWWIPLYSTPPDSCKLQVFNRWGELIFETNQWDKGWDGTKKGALVQEDVYVYKLAVKFSSEEKKRVYTGHVTIIR